MALFTGWPAAPGTTFVLDKRQLEESVAAGSIALIPEETSSEGGKTRVSFSFRPVVRGASARPRSARTAGRRLKRMASMRMAKQTIDAHELAIADSEEKATEIELSPALHKSLKGLKMAKRKRIEMEIKKQLFEKDSEMIRMLQETEKRREEIVRNATALELDKEKLKVEWLKLRKRASDLQKGNEELIAVHSKRLKALEEREHKMVLLLAADESPQKRRTSSHLLDLSSKLKRRDEEHSSRLERMRAESIKTKPLLKKAESVLWMSDLEMESTAKSVQTQIVDVSLDMEMSAQQIADLDENEEVVKETLRTIRKEKKKIRAQKRELTSAKMDLMFKEAKSQGKDRALIDMITSQSTDYFSDIAEGSETDEEKSTDEFGFAADGFSKSQVILTRVWNLLKAAKMQEALETLITFEDWYKITECVPVAGIRLPLWALMPSRLPRTDALASLPVWRFILKKFDVGVTKHVDMFGTEMTPMSISASFDLDEYVRAVIAEEQLQGTVKEQVTFAEKCEVLQHNCILMIEAMRLTAANENDRAQRKLRVFEVVRETICQKALGALDKDTMQQLAAAVSEKVAADSESQLLDSALGLMRDALISLTKEKRCVLSEVWNLCWEWQKLNGKKSLWLNVRDKIKEVLSFPDLCKKPTDWQWFLQNWANNPVMAELSVVGDFEVDTISDESKDETPPVQTKYDYICDLCDSELEKQRKEIECDMGALIAANEEKWAAVGGFKYANAKFPDAKSWRQDKIDDGVVAGVKKADLFAISLFTSALDFDAAQTYDLDSYLTDILTTAHRCNFPFQKFMEEAYGGVCEVHSGPVKSFERCRVKAQLEYGSSKFPTSARLIDLIRCSLTFEDIGSFYDCLQEFVRIADTGKIKKASRRSLLSDLLSKHRLKLDIMRCKNGLAFARLKEGVHFTKRSAGGSPVPCQYGDVKLNVIVSTQSGERKVAVIGEVQLLLSAMLKAKLAAHQFYEVTRRKPFFESVRQHFPVFARNLKIAGSTQKQLAPVLVRQPLCFTEEVFTDTATDHANRNFLMRLMTTKELKLDLVEYLFTLPIGVPDAVWLQQTEDNMTLLKYVLGLGDECDEEIVPLFLSQIPAALCTEIWTLADPLHYAMEFRATIGDTVLGAMPKEVDWVWNDSRLLIAAIQNKDAKGLLSRLRLLASRMNELMEELYGVMLRRALPTDELKMTPLMAAIYFHGEDGIGDAVIDYLIPAFEDTAEECKEMIEYWTHAADNGCTIVDFAAKYSDKHMLELLKRQMPAAAIVALAKLSTDTKVTDLLTDAAFGKGAAVKKARAWQIVRPSIRKAFRKPMALKRYESKFALATVQLLDTAAANTYGAQKKIPCKFLLTKVQLKMLTDADFMAQIGLDFRYFGTLKVRNGELIITCKRATLLKKAIGKLERKVEILWTREEIQDIMREISAKTGEFEEADFDDNAKVTAFLNKMTEDMRGHRFRKHSKKCKALRHWVLLKGGRLYWKWSVSAEEKKAQSFLFTRVAVIKTGIVARDSKYGAVVSEAHCFSIFSGKAVLVLEADSEEVAYVWVRYLRALVKHVSKFRATDK